MKMNLHLLRILVLFGHEKELIRKLGLFIAILAIALVQNSSYANAVLTDSQPPKKSKNIITKTNPQHIRYYDKKTKCYHYKVFSSTISS